MDVRADSKRRLEDSRFLTGKGQYIADLVLPGMVHMAIVRSPEAHALIRRLDTSAAAAGDGVLAVLTGADLAADGVTDIPCGVAATRRGGGKVFEARRPPLSRDRVRHVGEPVAIVVAETIHQARAAAELVTVEYEALPAVVTSEGALASGAPVVWDEVADNVSYFWTKGDHAKVDAALAAAPHVVRLTSQISRATAVSLETRGAIGVVEADGRHVVHTSSQGPHGLKGLVAPTFGIKPDQVRVVARDVGGSFGMKGGIYVEEVLVLWAAKRIGRPVRWIAERTEGFLADDHGRDARVEVALGLDKDGRFLALKAHFDVNIGAYLTGRSLGNINNVGGIAGVYRIPAIAASLAGIHTNTVITAPYRGAGRPEATYTIERIIDIAARELGLDPFEIRLKNLIPKITEPYDTGLLFVYDCGEFEGNMREAARLADRAGIATRKAEAAKRGKLLGVGISNPIENAGGPFGKPGKDMSSVDIAADGTVTIASGSMSTGQGHETTFSGLVADRLGVPAGQVKYRLGDTDNLAVGRGSGGSSATSTGGTSMARTVEKVIAKGKALAAEMLEAKADDIDFDNGAFKVRGTNRGAGLLDVARFAESKGARLAETGEFQPALTTFPNGCHMCEVEIDPETGATEIVRYTVVEDLGNVLQPALVEGQMHGGIAQGAGQALGEAIVYEEETGQLLSASLMDYALPRADFLPAITVKTRAVPTKVNDLGAKGVGEAGTVGSLVATINAVCDALAPLGITHIEMPATAPRIWEAIRKAKAGKKA